jgi:hypothetical protein
MKKIIIVALFFTFFLGFSYAQPTGPNPNTTPTPIGGITLIIAALAFGSKQVYDANKK